MSATTIEERAERVRMALAEAGHPEAVVFIELSPADGTPIVRVRRPPSLTRRQVWAAFRIVGESPLRCWACFSADGGASPRAPACLARGEGIEDCGRDRS